MEESKSVLYTGTDHSEDQGKNYIEIPEHLTEIYESSKDHLTQPQQQEFAKLLYNFADVFAKDEFDLRDFSEITQLGHAL